MFTHRVIVHSKVQLEIIVFAAVVFYYNSVSQTLVYENYNKFISATDTIRRMKDDFKHMEEQMEVDLSIIPERIFVFFPDKAITMIHDNGVVNNFVRGRNLNSC